MPKKSELEYFLDVYKDNDFNNCLFEEYTIPKNTYDELTNGIIAASLGENAHLIAQAYQYLTYKKVKDIKEVLEFSETMAFLVGYKFAVENYHNFQRDKDIDLAYDIFKFVLDQNIEYKEKEYNVLEFVKDNLYQMHDDQGENQSKTDQQIENKSVYASKIEALDMIKPYQNFIQKQRLCSLPKYLKTSIVKRFDKSLTIYKNDLSRPHFKQPKFKNTNNYIKKIRKELQN